MEAFGEGDGDKDHGEEVSPRSFPTPVQVQLGVLRDIEGKEGSIPSLFTESL